MDDSPQTVLVALLRQDFYAFVEKCFATLNPGEEFQEGVHIDVLCDALQRAERGDTRRILVNMPPRYLKSLITSVAYPAWVLGRNPGARIICVSYSQDLADTFSNQTRAIMESNWYQALFPRTRLDPRKNTESEFSTTARGFRKATSIGGTITGRGGSYIIIDDPMKPDEAISETARKRVNFWYDNTLYSRLDNKERGVIALIMQRLHDDDLTAHVQKTDQWEHLRFPAIAIDEITYELDRRTVTRAAGSVLQEARESRPTLEGIRARIGSFSFAAQYQQEPIALDGNLFKWTQFKFHTEPAGATYDYVMQSLDTASMTGERNDYSVCTTWGIRGNNYYILAAFRERFEFPALLERTLSEYRRFKPAKILIEHSGHAGIQLKQTLQDYEVLGVRLIRPRWSKSERAAVYALPAVEAGRVYLPQGAPWLEEFRREILAFPNGAHDDFVDSISQALKEITQVNNLQPQRRNPVRSNGPALPRSRATVAPDPIFDSRLPFTRGL